MIDMRATCSITKVSGSFPLMPRILDRKQSQPVNSSTANRRQSGLLSFRRTNMGGFHRAPTTASGRRSEVVSSPLTAVATQMQPLIPCSHFELPAVRKQTWLLFQNFASLCGNNDQMVLKR
ncbi:predicted protein [Plenodomus lingam JN3]|uniref:Uncharacterized protein n=1 Tax=Leptosphaeria maculans (strain JN3 / isolate v23.1.3 / race Av1-4-5-6-7-8) TaxID=985895 RepID=E4ZFU4_LEPMJ|nr:predicted protein [Plenodomus lingam JN3]CBX90164.1 predicted protein [Plenodomus lingam JN3]